jgi:aspartyl/asparaginyl-tRNA synthetase
MRPVINYRAMADAIDYYKKAGYEYVEVPWIVDEAAVNVTRPPGGTAFYVRVPDSKDHTCLVASAEQSFLQIRDELCPGRKYMTVSPCFRYEKFPDELHHQDFVKLELIAPLWKTDDHEPVLRDMVKTVLTFFNNRFVPSTEVQTDIGTDIVALGEELGSYGYREHETFRWVYGTGLAEPRMSQIRQLARDRADRMRV